MNDDKKSLVIEGAGGKGKDPYEAPDNLRSRATARIIDVVSQGPIKGLVDGMKSVYLNDTQLQSDDNSFNFNGVNVQERLGYADQNPVYGFGGTRTGAQAPNSGDPLEHNIPRTQNILNSPVAPSAVALTFQVGPFLKRTKKGDILGTTVRFKIEIEGVLAYTWSISGKQDESYQRQIRLDLRPDRYGDGPWDVTVTRLTPNDDDIKHQEDLYWVAYETIFDDKYMYPYSAYYATAFDAEAYGNSLPKRGYDVEGLLVELPDNYDPETREYIGTWGGSFGERTDNADASDGYLGGTRYTNNPAMVLRDLIRNDRYGAGNIIPPSLLEDSVLYQIAQYCDGRVYDGNGLNSVTRMARISTSDVRLCQCTTAEPHGLEAGDYVFIKGFNQPQYNGAFKIIDVRPTQFQFRTLSRPAASPGTGDGFVGHTEIRFTFNHQFTSQEDAINVLQAITSVFQGMLYYLNNRIIAVADMPKDATLAVSPSNVIGGDFSYSSNINRLRHSVALITWNDPDVLYKKAIEVVERPDLIQDIGWRPLNLTVLGCTSRGQAHRFGQWALYAEKYEAEFITYTAGFDHAVLAPGDIIAVNDPTRAGKRASGRVLSATPNSMTIDGNIELPDGTNQLYITAPDGRLNTRTLSNSPGTTNSLTWNRSTVNEEAEVQAAQAGSVWVAILANLKPEYWRVLKVSEVETGQYEVNAMLYQANKFDYVDGEVYLEPSPTNVLPSRTTIASPTNVKATIEFIVYSNRIVPYINLAWTSPSDAFLEYIQIMVRHGDGNWEEYARATSNNYKIMDPAVGVWEIRVVAVNRVGAVSSAGDGSDTVTIEYVGDEIPTANGLTLIEGLELYQQANDTEFRHRDAKFSWTYVSPNQEDREFADGTVSQDIVFKDYVIQIWDNGVLVREEADIKESIYTYTLEKNIEDQERLKGGGADPLRTFEFHVAMRDIFDNYSAFAKLTVSNPAPEIAGKFRVEGTFGGAEGSWEVPLSLLDYSGALLHMSATKDFVPSDENLIRDIKDGSEFYVNISGGETRHFRVALYDTFGKTGLNYSDPVSINVPTKLDTEAPEIPTGLALSSRVITNDNGDQRVKLIVTLNRNEEADMSFYDVAVKEGTGNYVTYAVPQVEEEDRPTLELIVSPNTVYTAKARAIDENGNKSGYSDPVEETSAKDNTPPANPTGFSILAGMRTVQLSWTNPTDNDFSYTEIYEGTSNSFADADLVKTSFGDQTIRSGLTTGTTYYYWIRAVDTSGNKSGQVGPVNATAQQVKTEDIARLAITTPLIANEGITETKIGNDAISTRTIQANAVTANELAANSVRARSIVAGTITANELAANSVTAPKITSNAVTTTKLAAEAVTANKLAAGSVIADKIASGAITTEKLNADLVLAETIRVRNRNTLGNIDSWANNPAARINSASTLIGAGKISISGNTTLNSWRYGGDNTLMDGGAIAANTVTANKLTIGNRGLSIDGLQFTHRNGSTRTSWTAGEIIYINDRGSERFIEIEAGNSTSKYIYWVKDEDKLRGTNTLTTAQGANNVIMAIRASATNLVVNYGGTIVDGSNIITGSITADRLAAGVVQTSNVIVGDHIRLDGPNNEFYQRDDNNRHKLFESTTNGVTIRNTSGTVLFDTSGAQNISASNVSGLGSLATQNSISYNNVSGTKPPINAAVNAPTMAMRLNRDDNGTNNGEVLIVGVDQDGNYDQDIDGFFLWDGQKRVINRYECRSSNTDPGRTTFCTGGAPAGTKGFLVWAISGSPFNISNSLGKKAAFCYKDLEGYWRYDNNSGTTAFTPNDSMIAIAVVNKPSSGDSKITGGFIEPKLLEAASFQIDADHPEVYIQKLAVDTLRVKDNAITSTTAKTLTTPQNLALTLWNNISFVSGGFGSPLSGFGGFYNIPGVGWQDVNMLTERAIYKASTEVIINGFVLCAFRVAPNSRFAVSLRLVRDSLKLGPVLNKVGGKGATASRLTGNTTIGVEDFYCPIPFAFKFNGNNSTSTYKIQVSLDNPSSGARVNPSSVIITAASMVIMKALK